MIVAVLTGLRATFEIPILVFVDDRAVRARCASSASTGGSHFKRASKSPSNRTSQRAAAARWERL
jgi:hypothetical protein